jgi:hypothetical protein
MVLVTIGLIRTRLQDRIKSHSFNDSMYDIEVLNLQPLSFSNRNRALFAVLVTIT